MKTTFLMSFKAAIQLPTFQCFFTSFQVKPINKSLRTPMLIKKFWTPKEDKTIIQRERTKNWKQLASILPGRVDQKDVILIELYMKLGNQWVKMTESLPRRNDKAIMNCWNSTLRKRRGCSPKGSGG
jgi:replication initiation and membrane attachment protein DnaB